ncbi:hypothetical protein AK830_g3122 [Neonectria ditissima]|uniref:Uncharacterized protein n=1 Tax=Neonectria ditissima TaxID=78410 RepID=A0A0P7BIM6_9HYPO|nr:hypothetical protein AK830_g3122 [Neonectria ditissima]
MDINDIRRRYDIINNVDTVARTLQGFPPPSTDVWNTSGLDCLVTVIRHIYSIAAIGPNGFAQDRDYVAGEKKNPILVYAWQKFKRPIGADEVLSASRAKAVLIEKVRDLTENHFHTVTFEGLCMSSLMDNTLWSLPDFQLFTALQFKEATCEWLPAPWTARERVHHSSLHLNLADRPRMTLQRLIDNCYGLRRIRGIETLCLHNTPLVVRVLFTPGLRRVNDMFSTIRHFKIPMHAGMQPHERVNYLYAPDVNYGLLAVVRLRFGPGQDDLIRTYGPGGDYIVFDYEPGGYMNSGWSVNDRNDARYMLFYGASDRVRADPTLPEVVTQPPRNVLPVTHFGNQPTRIPSSKPLNPNAPEFHPQHIFRPTPWNINHRAAARGQHPVPNRLSVIPETPVGPGSNNYGSGPNNASGPSNYGPGPSSYGSSPSNASGPSNYGPGSSNYTPSPSNYGSSPNNYAPGSSNYTPGSNNYGPGPSNYGPNSSNAPGPSNYVPGPSDYAPDPRNYGSGPSNYASGPSNYTSGPSNYAPGPSNYTSGPSNYAPGPSSYGPGPGNYSQSQQREAVRQHYDARMQAIEDAIAQGAQQQRRY